MSIKIALAGNPNCGKTTLFNALTGSNQFVGNWPGVTVEKKEGRLKGHKDVAIMDLPGIYSLSPYTLEEVVARNYLINERPDAIINIVDGTNIERNLYLSTQIMELGIPVIMAVNMVDIMEKNGDKVDLAKLGKNLGCEAVEISALKGTGIKEAAEKAVKLAESKKVNKLAHKFSDEVESVIEAVEDKIGLDVVEEQKRFFAIKLLEKDDKIGQLMSSVPDVTAEIDKLEKDFDDDTESIITNERYTYISSIIGECVKKAHSKDKLTTSDKIDKIVTNRILALPIFAVVMFLVYYIAMVTVGSAATDWANDGLFGDGFHLFGIGTSAYEEVADEYGDSDEIIAAYVESLGSKGEAIADAIDTEAEDYDSEDAVKALTTLKSMVKSSDTVDYSVEDEETLATEDFTADADDIKCGPFGTQLNRDEYKAKGVAVWEIPQINSGFSEMPTHFITEEKAVILNAYSIEPGDIAMSRKGNVGKCGLFPENLKKGIIHSDVLRIRVDKRKVDSCFMMYQLHFSEAVKRQIEMVSSGAIMAGINVTKLKQIKVRIPELENQRMFAAFVERVDQQKQTIQQSLEKLELLKKALMQEYFG